ncbi:MAG: ATP-dependent nuclease [Ignavibacteriaceae bacterium]
MYLNKLRLWNFRKFGSEGNSFVINKPNLVVPFSKGLNLLIGENDSGKSAIIDSIKLILKTHTAEWAWLEHDDFYNDSNRLRIECEFAGFLDIEAKNFTEWLGWYGEGENALPYLKVFIDVKRNNEKILPFDVRAGVDEIGNPLPADAKEYLKVTYLKPLRDAKSELTPKRNSRLSQILQGHEAFHDKDEAHFLFQIFQNFNSSIENYFEGKDSNGNDLNTDNLLGKELKDEIDKYLGRFSHKLSQFKVTDPKLRYILERLELAFLNERNLGLGSHNLLFMSSELLHLNKNNWSGIRLGLIEEIEAHLHPQIQLQVIESLQKEDNIQLIFSTHSPNIGSKINLKNLIICHNDNVFPLDTAYTRLCETDYTFLERFLDVTKANLFFASGIIFVEGWAEELIVPALAKKMGYNLTEKGISVINVGNTAFLRYSKIFQRKENPQMKIPVAIITDVDVKPEEENQIADGITKLLKQKNIKEKKYNGSSVRTFVSEHWTLEYCLALSAKLRKYLYKAVLMALREQKENDGIQDLKDYIEAISNNEQHFNNWTEDSIEIAKNIYRQIIGEDKILELCKEKISKSIIAQHFARILENEISFTKDELEEEDSIQYLLNAIKYASGN